MKVRPGGSGLRLNWPPARGMGTLLLQAHEKARCHPQVGWAVKKDREGQALINPHPQPHAGSASYDLRHEKAPKFLAEFTTLLRKDSFGKDDEEQASTKIRYGAKALPR